MQNNIPANQYQTNIISNHKIPEKEYYNNYYDHYFNDRSQQIKIKRKFNNNEINNIIESCKQNLMRLQNTCVQYNKKSINFSNQNNNNLMIDNYMNKNITYKNNYNKRRNSKRSVDFSLLKKSYDDIDNGTDENNKYKIINNNYSRNNNNTSKSNELKFFKQNKSKSYFSRKDNNLYQNEKNYSDYENIKYDNTNDKNNIYFQGNLSHRNHINNNYRLNEKLIFNKYRNKQKYSLNRLEKDQYNRNYLKLLDSLEVLKSKVNNYQKTNLELKKEIQLLNNKISILSKKDDSYNKLIDISIKSNEESGKKANNSKDNYYIKKMISSYRGSRGKRYNNNDHINSLIKMNQFPSQSLYNLKIKDKLNLENKENKNRNYFNNKDNYEDKNNDFESSNKIKKTRNLFNKYQILNNNVIKTNNLKKNEKFSYLYRNNIIAENNSINGRVALYNQLNNNLTKNNNFNEIPKKILNNNEKINDNSNIINNKENEKKIIKKKVFLKKQLSKPNKVSDNFIDVKNNELDKKKKNNIVNRANSNEGIIELNRSSSDINYKNKIKNKSFPNIHNNYNNFIYKKKTQKLKSKSFHKSLSKVFNSEPNKIAIIKVPLNKLKTSTLNSRLNKIRRDKATRIYKAINSIDIIDTTKYNKKKILQRILNNSSKNINSINSINKLDNNDDLYLFGIDEKNNLIQFDISLKQFSIFNIFNIKDISQTFSSDYNYNSSIILNTLKGLYILSGKGTNILYFYCAKTKLISKICTFAYTHNDGSLLFDINKNRIFAFSGKKVNKCEYFSFKEEKIREIGELNIDRVYASYALSNNKILCFFGYSFSKKQYLNNIEIIDYDKLGKWEIKYINNKIDFNIERCANIIYNNYKSEIYLYIERKNYELNLIKRTINIYDINKNEIIKKKNIEEVKHIKENSLWKCLNDEKREKYNESEFYFEKYFNFLVLPKEMNNNYFDNNNDNIAVILDNKNNVHYFYRNGLKFEVYKKSL